MGTSTFAALAGMGLFAILIMIVVGIALGALVLAVSFRLVVGFMPSYLRALGAVGAEFQHVNIFEDPELREALKQYSNWPTYPQLYVNGELVGGSDIIIEMYKTGELQKLIGETAKA